MSWDLWAEVDGVRGDREPEGRVTQNQSMRSPVQSATEDTPREEESRNTGSARRKIGSHSVGAGLTSKCAGAASTLVSDSSKCGLITHPTESSTRVSFAEWMGTGCCSGGPWLLLPVLPPAWETAWDLGPFTAMLIPGHTPPGATKIHRNCMRLENDWVGALLLLLLLSRLGRVQLCATP